MTINGEEGKGLAKFLPLRAEYEARRIAADVTEAARKAANVAADQPKEKKVD